MATTTPGDHPAPPRVTPPPVTLPPVTLPLVVPPAAAAATVAASASSTGKGVPELGSELFELVKGYAKQEVVDPIKPLGRFLAWGLAGSIASALGVVFLVVGSLRLLQVEWDPTEGLSWLPYLIVLVGAVLLIVYYLKAIKSDKAST